MVPTPTTTTAAMIVPVPSAGLAARLMAATVATADLRSTSPAGPG